ncbi:MAG: hypothetical protein FJ267_08830 [Planctomycetes bacterium]|nr:hypothetical protein [Planctomycetota bacterium]
MKVLGLDIGGANLKAATNHGQCVSRPFPLWKSPEKLSSEIAWIFDKLDGTTCQAVALTMTGELADCFRTKAQGVSFIVDAVQAAITHLPIHVWTTSDGFVTPKQAILQPMSVAAANWHVLATWCGRWIPSGVGLLIDIGSTTTDIIPIVEGVPASKGKTDVERLLAGELSYSGVRRTPVCAIAQSVPFSLRGMSVVESASVEVGDSRSSVCALESQRMSTPVPDPPQQGEGEKNRVSNGLSETTHDRQSCPLAAELFATTLDLYLLLGDIPEDTNDTDTANGQTATIDAAHGRLARMLCCDQTEVSLEAAMGIARFLADVQRRRLTGALEQVLKRLPNPCQSIIISGSGSFLASRIAFEHKSLSKASRRSLEEKFTPQIAESACAYAVAQLCEVRVQSAR